MIRQNESDRSNAHYGIMKSSMPIVDGIINRNFSLVDSFMFSLVSTLMQLIILENKRKNIIGRACSEVFEGKFKTLQMKRCNLGK